MERNLTTMGSENETKLEVGFLNSLKFVKKIIFKFRLRKDLLKSVDAELVMSRTLLEIESSRDNDFNYVGVYITSEDKVRKTHANAFYSISSLTLLTVAD